MFVWVFHRASGLLLILLLGLKYVSAFPLMTREGAPDWALTLHTNPLVDVLLILMGVYHAAYGLRTLVLDLGLRRERLAFWVSSSLALVASVALLVLYFSRDY